jgi:hypothetical protein
MKKDNIIEKTEHKVVYIKNVKQTKESDGQSKVVASIANPSAKCRVHAIAF